MTKDSSENTISIDNKDYLISDLSENAKIQLANINFVDQQLLQLNNEWAVFDTARIGYTAALKKELG